MKTKIKLNQMKTDELLEEIQKNNLKVLEIEKITEEECDCGVPHSYLRFEGELDEDFIYQEYGEDEGDKIIENSDYSCGECRDREYVMCRKRDRVETNTIHIRDLLKSRGISNEYCNE